MHIISKILIVAIGLLHLYFLWLEMFVWTTAAKKYSELFPKIYLKNKNLAANQGLYNGFYLQDYFGLWLFQMKIGAKNIALFFFVV